MHRSIVKVAFDRAAEYDAVVIELEARGILGPRVQPPSQQRPQSQDPSSARIDFAGAGAGLRQLARPAAAQRGGRDARHGSHSGCDWWDWRATASSGQERACRPAVTDRCLPTPRSGRGPSQSPTGTRAQLERSASRLAVACAVAHRSRSVTAAALPEAQREAIEPLLSAQQVEATVAAGRVSVGGILRCSEAND